MAKDGQHERSCGMTRVSYQGIALAMPQSFQIRQPPLGPARRQPLQSFTDLRTFLFLGSRGGSFHLPSPKSSSHCRTSSSRVVPFAFAICSARSSSSASALNVIFCIAIVFLPQVKIGAVPSFRQLSLVYSPRTCPPSTSDSRNRPGSFPTILPLRFSGSRRLSVSPSRN